MTHLGDGNFGQATGKKIHVRTVADCVCKDNLIVHEWLVRDQGAIAVGVGSTPENLARQWLAARSTPLLPLPQPAAPIWWRDPMDNEPIATNYAERVGQMLMGAGFDETLYDEAACSLGPVNSTHYGREEIKAFYAAYASCISAACYKQESIAFMPASSGVGRPPRLSLRWRLKGKHTGQGKFGASQGNSLDILGINHAGFVKVNGQWQVHREWVLIDEVAVWMQVLDGTVSKV
jgi:hypothetical protein